MIISNAGHIFICEILFVKLFFLRKTDKFSASYCAILQVVNFIFIFLKKHKKTCFGNFFNVTCIC